MASPPWRVATTLAVVAASLSTLRWMFAIVTVRGPSMEPALVHGDRLLARRCPIGQLGRGDLAIFREPGLQRRRPVWLTGAGQDVWVVKRVCAVAGDPVPDSVRVAADGASVVPKRTVVVLGDGPASRDSRHWGLITASHLFGAGTRLPRRGGPSVSGTVSSTLAGRKNVSLWSVLLVRTMVRRCQ